MNLESLLKPLKMVDGEILRQYSKAGKRFNLYEGRKRYLVGLGFWAAYAPLSAFGGSKLIGPLNEASLSLVNDYVDWIYNAYGSLGLIKKGGTLGGVAADQVEHFCKKYNSIIRLPTFTAGAGLVGKFGLDALNYISNGEPIKPSSYSCLEYGLSLLSLASSMYIKEIDPKLLNKKPVFEKAYSWLKDKATSFVPKPLPQPVPVKAYNKLENRL